MVEADRLIDEVEARPGLYDRSMPDYSNKSIKESLWMEIAETLVDEWADLSEVERIVKSKEIQFKWKHIRDNFRRELLVQTRKSKHGRRKRKYKFFDKMSFLTPHVSALNGSENNAADDENEAEETETHIIIAEEMDSPPVTNRPPPRNTYARSKSVNTSNSVTPSILRQRRKKKTTTEEEILKALKSKESFEADEDRTFCLSLVSSLKKMSDGTKLNAKIDILKVIRQHTTPQPYDSPAHSLEDTFLPVEELTVKDPNI